MEINQPFIVAFLMGILLLYLYLTKQLSQSALLIVGGGVVLALLMMQYNPKEITIDEAERIAELRIKKLQLAGRIPDGTIAVLPEAELKSFVYVGSSPEVIPYKYDVLASVETGMGISYYLVGISKYGSVLSTTELKRKKSVKETAKEFTEIKGKPEFIRGEPDAKGKEEKNVRG